MSRAAGHGRLLSNGGKSHIRQMAHPSSAKPHTRGLPFYQRLTAHPLAQTWSLKSGDSLLKFSHTRKESKEILRSSRILP